MKFFYQAGTMGYGDGYWWHRFYNFPKLPFVTKTLTLKSKLGIPFAIVKAGNTVWNRVGLHNIGIDKWFTMYGQNVPKETIISIAGYDSEVEELLCRIDLFCGMFLSGIELNFSCPNVKSYENKKIPYTNLMKLLNCPLYLKLNYEQDPYEYDLSNVSGIRLNSVPALMGGLSGKAAQKKNWEFIRKYNKEGLNIAGCSFTSFDDIKKLEDMGCKEIGIGSIILTNPKLVEQLRNYKDKFTKKGK